jgi:hypothetical protein
MPFQPTASRVTVLTAPIAIASNVERDSLAVLVRNVDASLSVFLGDSTVTTSTGFELRAGEAMRFSLTDGQTMFAISALSVVVDVMQRVSQ